MRRSLKGVADVLVVADADAAHTRATATTKKKEEGGKRQRREGKGSGERTSANRDTRKEIARGRQVYCICRGDSE